ncbi:TPA: HNH endonuclease [Methanosarcinaceae archaeon]|nr:HNH endonuclease [Methanosarcinaceae archaeon]
MNVKKIFKMPKQVNIAGRTSSITNAFVNGIIPQIEPTEYELNKCLKILELNKDDLRCVYCNEKVTEWDHLRPIVKNKQPTGYISDIYNLVPSCGKCNQSKGNKYWRDWIKSDAPQSPKSKKIKDLDKRIQRLEEYEEWGNVKPINFETIVSKELWEIHWDNHKKLCEMMQNSKHHADKLKEEIYRKLEL